MNNSQIIIYANYAIVVYIFIVVSRKEIFTQIPIYNMMLKIIEM